MSPLLQKSTPVALQQVEIKDTFWSPKLQVNREVTIPAVYQRCQETGRLDAWKLTWRPGQPPEPHVFWDSDVAKWIEAAAHSLATQPSAKLETLLDELIDTISRAQQSDGYLNTHFTVVHPEWRWKNLRDWHELYCAGHLIEAAVAYFHATGKRKLLDAVCRYVDHIESVFGVQPGQKRGYDGHEEIELALVKLYQATGEKRYLQLAKYFVDERGRQPNYFDVEARERGEDPASYWAKTHEYTQSHIPVREQTLPVGHAVRGMYLYAAMADLAVEYNDSDLLTACKRIWRHLVHQRMYVTGGIGSSRANEGHTADYDLPNETAYAETCAAIGLVLFTHRLLQIEPEAIYADVLERELYNGCLSGVSLNGDRFFTRIRWRAAASLNVGNGTNAPVARRISRACWRRSGNIFIHKMKMSFWCIFMSAAPPSSISTEAASSWRSSPIIRGTEKSFLKLKVNTKLILNSRCVFPVGAARRQ